MARGLLVQLVPVETADVAAGLVTAVGPEGELAPGTAVTVSYAVAPIVTPPAGNGNDGGTGGNGKGKGHGNGKGGDD